MTAGILAKHVRMNHLADRVKIVPMAVDESVGTATLHVMDADGMSRLYSPNPLLGNRTTPVGVPVTTVDAFCREHDLAPNWLFIDIEGFEIGALVGAAETVSRQRHDLSIVVELHPSAWPTAGTTKGAAETLFQDLGVAPVALTGQRDPLSEHGLVYLRYE
jgi:FkbM family methyltransferase